MEKIEEKTCCIDIKVYEFTEFSNRVNYFPSNSL